MLFSVAEASGDTQALWLEYRRTNDRAVRDRLILTYSPLVKFVAGRLGASLPSHVDEQDLVSYGLLGLIGAIERYDPEREIKFETFAIARIKGAIIDELRSLAGQGTKRQICATLRALQTAGEHLEANVNARLVLESLMLRLPRWQLPANLEIPKRTQEHRLPGAIDAH